MSPPAVAERAADIRPNPKTQIQRLNEAVETLKRAQIKARSRYHLDKDELAKIEAMNSADEVYLRSTVRFRRRRRTRD